eukprot:6055349-Heterocapsa_arctica.AAC.1
MPMWNTKGLCSAQSSSMLPTYQRSALRMRLLLGLDFVRSRPRSTTRAREVQLWTPLPVRPWVVVSTLSDFPGSPGGPFSDLPPSAQPGRGCRRIER